MEWRKAFLTMTQNSDKTKEKIDEFVYIKIKTSKWCQKKKKREREREGRDGKKKTQKREKRRLEKYSYHKELIFLL